MRLFTPLIVLGFSLVGLINVQAGEPESEERITLLGTLADWQYPGSKWINGASMCDGQNPSLQSIKCETILTTADSFEKVTEYYAKKFAEFPTADKKGGKTVSIQDDSAGRPVKIKVFVVNKANTSTTLVVSRAKGEQATHITWSHYIRLGAKP